MTQIQRDTMTSRKLYEELIGSRYNWHPYKRDKNRGEDMEILSQLITGYWRERFLGSIINQISEKVIAKDVKVIELDIKQMVT